MVAALGVAAEVVRDPRVAALLDNPRITPDELANLVSGIAGEKLGGMGANFVGTLAVNHRLGFLPEIAALFDTFKDEALGVADVTVTASEPRHVFDSAASYALAHSRYKPVIRDGVPVAQRAHLRERFQP